MAYFGSHRPFLSIILAASTTTFSLSYPFANSNPLNPVLDRFGGAARFRALKRSTKGVSTLVVVLQYIIAALAAANVVQQSYDITQRTVVSWSCPNVGSHLLLQYMSYEHH